MQPRAPSHASHHGTCLYCRGPLGTNDLLATMPVGRRFAYDPVQRRLWIVCASCRRWCASASYALDEVLEECERHRSDASRARASDRLARHPSGVEWIRLDGASPLELAVWRYGNELAPAPWRVARSVLGEAGEAWLLERRDGMRGMLSAAPYLVGGLAVGVASSAVLAQASALGLVLLAFFKMFTADSEAHDQQLERLRARAQVVLGRIGEAAGGSFLLHADQAFRSRLVIGQGRASWRLSVPARSRPGDGRATTHDVEGREAVRALRLALPEADRAPAGTVAVRAALRAIESAGGAQAFLDAAPAEAARRGLRYASLGELPHALRLSLEIAVDEAHERSALEGDPARLEREWKEVDELAALTARPQAPWTDTVPSLAPGRAALSGEPL